MFQICLFIALIATFIWINVTVADLANGKANIGITINDASETNKAKIKMYLVLIMAIFWTIVTFYKV